MMKKVLFGVAMALLASVSVGTLQSCKDDVSDLKTQTSFDLVKLEQDLATAKGNLQEQITANKNSITKTLQLLGDYAKIEYVERRLAELNQDIKNKLTALEASDNAKFVELRKELQGAWGKINVLELQQAQMLAQISGALNDISWLKDKINGENGILSSIGNLSAAFSSLQTRVAELEETIKGCVKDKDFQNLVGRVEVNEASIDLINDAINGLRSDLVDMNNQIDDINNQLGANSESIENLKYKLMLLKKEVSQLKEDLNDLKNDVTALTTRVKKVEDQLTDLTNQVDQLVTGILIQGVHSPVFGDFSLPIGVKSNIIFNWYGYNKGQKPISFPSSRDDLNARGNLNIDPAVGIDNISNPEFIPGGSYYPAADTLGIVYVTLNPQGSKFSAPVKVVNSLGEPLPFEVTLKPSNNKLMHGYTRAIGDEGCINNGLYEGAVVLDPRTDKDRQEIEVTVDEQLATSMKNALRDPSKSTAVALMKALYDQFNGKLPAYALNYGWNVAMSDPEVSPKAYSVLSQYDLAVATAKPLSYETLVAYPGSSKQLPIIDDIDNIIYDLKDKVKIEIEPLKEGDINIDLSHIDVTVDTEGVNLVMVIPDITVVDKDTKEFESSYNLLLTSKERPDGVDKDNLTGNAAGKKFVEDLLGKNYAANYPAIPYHYEHINGLDSLAGAIESGVKQGLTSAGTEITNNIREQINKNIIAKINKELKTQIDKVIDDLGDQFQPFFNKANRAFDLYNKIATKVNKFLKDPNAYFQVTALYSKGNDDYGFVSGSPTRPSVYKGNSDFSIFLTSYTGELIVPAYKKYVAITGKVEGGKVTPLNVNNSGLNSGDLNKVLDGNRIRVTVPAQKLAKGVYEFTYQALDYQGYTSTRKFYINIDK